MYENVNLSESDHFFQEYSQINRINKKVESLGFSNMLFAIHGILFLLLDCVLAKIPINQFIMKSQSTKMGLQSAQLQLLYQTLSRESVCIFLVIDI